MNETTLLLVEVGGMLLGLSLLGRLSMRFGISPIPLYLLAGLALGTGGALEMSASQNFFEIGAEIGVILLLAMLGLEYSAEELVGSLKRSRIAGLLDAAFNALPGAAFALLLGWGPIAAVALAGITWVSSSGVIAKLLRDLGRVGNRETPVILSILVIEDLAMAFYLPVLSALVIGAALLQGAIALVIAVSVVLVILFIALRFGNLVSRLFTADHAEPLLLGVLGLTMLVAGLAEQVSVSAAVGAFLVGIALSGPVAHNAAHSAAGSVRGDLFRFLRLGDRSERHLAGTRPRADPVRTDDCHQDLQRLPRRQACRNRRSRPLAHRICAHPTRGVLDRDRRTRGGSRRGAAACPIGHRIRAGHHHRRIGARPGAGCILVPQAGTVPQVSRPPASA